MAKQKKTKKVEVKKNYVNFILDRSSSMEPLRKEVIDQFNEEIKTIKEETKGEIKTKVSLVTFATRVDEPTIWAKSPRNLKKLTMEDYQPYGMTSLYDAVGSTIDLLKEQKDINDENVSVLFIIISDGCENNSKDYHAKLPVMIKEQEATGRWTFTYLGANQDMLQVAKSTGININNTQSFGASLQGVRAATVQTSDALKSYYSARKVGVKQVNNFYSNVTDNDNKDDDSKKEKSSVK